MDNGCRLLSDAAVHQEGHSDQDERDTETLSHIQNHILLETDLRLLDELDEEAHSEAADEEGSDEESSVEFRKSVLIHQYLEHSQKEVAECFIKLRRMLWFGLAPKFEDKAPWERSNISVDFRIEEISETDEGCCKTYRNCEMVENPYKIEVIFTTIMSCKPPHCNKESYCASVAGKTAFPRHEYLPESFPAAKIIVWLVEKTVSETRAYDSSDKKGIKKWIKKALRHSFSLEESLEYEPSEDESRDEQNRIPSERQRSYCYDLRIYAPIYC